MSAGPLVSVIIPSYCHEEFILDCLDSIYMQTHKDIEVVLIDDASSDSTFERATHLLSTSFGRRFSNVVARKSELNAGAHSSINHGIHLSSGDLIAIINSDDLYEPRRIEALLEALKFSQSQFAFSLVDVIGPPLIDEPAEIPPFLWLLSLRQKMDILREVTVGFSLLRMNVSISTGNFLFTRSLYNNVGPFLPLKYCHDWDFILQSLFYTEPVVVMEPLYKYRLHESNSFKGLAHLGQVEGEVVMRRLMRRGLTGRSINPMFPSEQNWPGYFEAFVEQLWLGAYLQRERGEGMKSWRVYGS